MLELTDSALQQASRRCGDLLRRAAVRVQQRQAEARVGIAQLATRANAILHDETRDWRDRGIKARTLLDSLDGRPRSFAAEVREVLAGDHRRVHECLSGLRELEFGGNAADPALEQWLAWSKLQDDRVTQLPAGFVKPTIGSTWRGLVDAPDREAGYQALAACTLMSLRKSLRRGSVWVDHSLTFRDRQNILIGAHEWSAQREMHAILLRLPTSASEFLTPVLAGAAAAMVALAEAVQRGMVEIGDDDLLHLPDLVALAQDREPRKIREALFSGIGKVQFPDLLLDVDASTHFSQALLGHRASSVAELLAIYGGLLAHGTDLDAKGVATMIPGLEVSQISAAMRALEMPGRLRRANERVAQYQATIPIAACWGDGDKGSADMMALDASRHLWTARVDPRRRTFAAGIYTHVRDRWGIFYDQPIVLNERQAGAALQGVELNNRGADLLRVSRIAVDTHGYTSVAMGLSKVLGFDLCPRLRNLRERKLMMPRGWKIPDELDAITARQISMPAIERGWDAILRLAASIRAGKLTPTQALRWLGSAAAGDPLHRALDHLGRLLRTLYLCDYFTIESFRREIHTLLNRGESVHQLQRAIYRGHVSPERGRRPDELVAISGALALLTNIVLAWNTARMDEEVQRLRRAGLSIDDHWLRRLGPAHFGHINFRGTFRFGFERYLEALVEGGAASARNAVI